MCDTVDGVQLFSCYTSCSDVELSYLLYLLLQCLAGIRNNPFNGYYTSNSSVDGDGREKLPKRTMKNETRTIFATNTVVVTI